MLVHTRLFFIHFKSASQGWPAEGHLQNFIQAHIFLGSTGGSPLSCFMTGSKNVPLPSAEATIYY